VERLALAYAEWCERWRLQLGRRPGFGDQVERACSSLVANLGEGSDAETLADKRRYFGYALASAGESLRLLRSARRTELLPAAALAEGLRLLRDIKWDLIRLVRWTRK